MTRWNRYYQKQIQNKDMARLVEEDLANLRLGVQIAKLRQQENLSQTQLAAKAQMSAPKISVMENKPKDLKLATLVRIARALNRDLEIRFKPRTRAAGAGA
jgi:transcriptional regulator with XRE-family HTH domain